MSTLILRDTIFEYEKNYILNINSVKIKNTHKSKIDKFILIRTVFLECSDVETNQNKISHKEYQKEYKKRFKSTVDLFFKNSNLTSQQIYDIIESVNCDENLTVYELENRHSDVRNIKFLPHYSYSKKELYNTFKIENI